MEYLSALSSVISKLDGARVQLDSDQHIYPSNEIKCISMPSSIINVNAITDGPPKRRHRDAKRPHIQIAEESSVENASRIDVLADEKLQPKSPQPESPSSLNSSVSPRRPPSSQRLPPRPPPPPPPKSVKDKAVVDEAVANIPGMAPPSTGSFPYTVEYSG